MDVNLTKKNGTGKYEICVVEEGKVVVFMSADTIKEAKKHRIRLREMYPDAAVEVFEIQKEHDTAVYTAVKKSEKAA